MFKPAIPFPTGTFRSFMWTGNETISFSTFQLLVIPLLLWCPAQAHGIKTQLHPGGFKIRILQKCWKRTEGRHKRTKKTSNTCLTILKEYGSLVISSIYVSCSHRLWSCLNISQMILAFACVPHLVCIADSGLLLAAIAFVEENLNPQNTANLNFLTLSQHKNNKSQANHPPQL